MNTLRPFTYLFLVLVLACQSEKESIEEDQEDNRRDELMDKIREALEKGDQESVDEALEELSEMENKEELKRKRMASLTHQMKPQIVCKSAQEKKSLKKKIKQQLGLLIEL